MTRILLIVFLSSSFVYCQSAKPPGTIKFNDSLYIDSTPITNYMFIEYLTAKDFLDKKGFESYKDFSEAHPGVIYSDVVMKEFDCPSPFLINIAPSSNYLKRKNYHIDTLYLDHPVLTVTKEQAIDYCQWRTEVVQDLWIYHQDQENKKDLATRIRYRLPSKTELLDAKNWFSTTNELINYKDQKLLKTLFEYHPKGYRVLPISEFTEDDNLFINEGVKRRKFIGFRCVCEIRK
jgi:formylglycine-generating enzyme required for sulfatase activity